MTFDEDIDAIGLLCPLPVLKLRKRLEGLVPGQVARLQASDPAARIDVPHFCSESGHDLISVQAVDDSHHFFVRKV